MYFNMLIFLGVLISCQLKSAEVGNEGEDVYIKVLGVAQDAGYPQIDCHKQCCERFWAGEEPQRQVVSLGLIDKGQNKVWMFEATPDFKLQYESLMSELENPDENSFGGVFLTHAHMGHYTGLMELGFEAMNSKNVPVYAMPKMKEYLTTNGPWSQLVSKNNINIIELQNETAVQLSDKLQVLPFLVPHRDEYSETVGYKISESRSVLFIPDINKWSIWDKNIVEEVRNVDNAYLDASFLNQEELPNRDMSQIPHPFVTETMALFDTEPAEIRRKVTFIHFNHTNKLLFDNPESERIRSKSYNIARNGSTFSLN